MLERVDHVDSGQPQDSVLVCLLEGILHSAWPSSSRCNTNKEILLLHELEALLEVATTSEFEHLLPRLLVSVDCCRMLDVIWMINSTINRIDGRSVQD